MYTSNYLSNLLRSKYTGSMLLGKTTVFTVINSITEDIVDTSQDCYFLSFLSTVIGDYSIGSSNTITLDQNNIIGYIMAKQYFYNSKLIDKNIFDILPIHYWIDITSDSLNWDTADIYFVTMPTKKTNTQSNKPYLYATASGSVPLLGVTNIYNVPTKCFTLEDNLCLVRIQETYNRAPYWFNASFTLVTVFQVTGTTTNSFIWSGNGSNYNRFYKLMYSFDGSTVALQLLGSYDGDVFCDDTVTTDAAFGDLITLIIVNDTSTLKMYLNNDDVSSTPFDSSYSDGIASKYLLSFGLDPATVTFNFFELFCSPKAATSNDVSVVKFYLAAKYPNLG